MRTRTGHRWNGELTGVRPLWGRGGSWGEAWHFRADLDGWAFQARISIRGESLLAGAKHTDPGASTRWGVTPCGPDGTSIAAAWDLIEACVVTHMAGELPVLGPDDHSPVSFWRYPRGEEVPWPLPEHAVLGDPSRQPEGGWLPRDVYLDDDRVCRQCGERFVFGAREQKHWYEDLRFTIESVAVRCPRCRHERRVDLGWQRRLSAAAETLRTRPNDADAHVAFAETMVEYHRSRGWGDLDRAIRTARLALRLRPDAHAARYWEARAQEMSGRPRRAADGYRDFVEASAGPGDTRLEPMRADAADRLVRLGAAES